MKKLTKLEDFYRYISQEKRLSTHTVEAYLSDLSFWQMAGLDLNHNEPPSVEDLRKALLSFEKLKLEDSTMARRASALRVFSKFRSLQETEWLDFLRHVPTSKLPQFFPKALELTEISQLLDFEVTNSRELRNRALLETLYASGLRVTEALELSWVQVRFREGYLRVLGKGKKERLVPISERALDWLEKYKNEAWQEFSKNCPRKYADMIFLSPRKKPLSRMAAWKILRARALECGIDDLHPHVLRHSFATHLLQGGADIRFVQAMLGHESLNATERYLKMADSELSKMFKELHPLP